MAATATVSLRVFCEGLGNGVVELGDRFVDSNTPDDYRRIDAIISSTAILLSSIINRTSAEVLGLALQARDGDVYVNSISTNISTAGQYIPGGEINFFTYSPGNSCKIALKGSDADTSLNGLVYIAVT